MHAHQVLLALQADCRLGVDNNDKLKTALSPRGCAVMV